MRSDADAGLLPRWRRALGVVVLVMLMLTALVSWQTHTLIRDNQEKRLAYESSQIDVALDQRMQAYVQIMRGAAGFFVGSDDVSRQEWADYVANLRLDELYPGMKSLSYAPAVADADLAALVARVRKEPIPAGTVDPGIITAFAARPPTGVPAAVEVHAPILYIAPWRADNQPLLGTDLMQDPVRRKVLEGSVAANDVLVSAGIHLATQTSNQAGFVAYIAVIRRGQTLGWITAAFRVPELMRGLHGGISPNGAFQISDDQGGLLYSTRPLNEDRSPQPLGKMSGLEQSGSVHMPGRTWHTRYVTTDDFTTRTERVATWIFIGTGLLVTALVFAVGWTGLGWRSRARTLAAQRSALTASEAIVRHQATHDGLTGLANRALFNQRLEKALGGPPFALAYIDIDGFKPVNDRLGHRAGDALLVTIAERLLAHVRGEDTVSRIGGDEFVVLVVEGDDADAIEVSEFGAHLAEVFDQPFAIDVDGTTHEVIVAASVGVARYPDDGSDSDELIHIADTAMFASKRANGR